MLIHVLTQFDVVLIAIMLSGIIVKMGKKHGTVIGDTRFKGFYFLFFALIAENILIVLLSTYFFLPFFEQVLFGTYLKCGSITVTLILLCNIWFAWTFGYRQKLGIITLTILSTITTLFIFIYS